VRDADSARSHPHEQARYVDRVDLKNVCSEPTRGTGLGGGRRSCTADGKSPCTKFGKGSCAVIAKDVLSPASGFIRRVSCHHSISKSLSSGWKQILLNLLPPYVVDKIVVSVVSPPPSCLQRSRTSVYAHEHKLCEPVESHRSGVDRP
jgi:hypothetical protein